MPVSNAVKGFWIRLLKGALPCRAYVAFKRNLGRGESTCLCCVGMPRAAGASNLELLSHLFFECPAFAAAKNWLLDLWLAVSGTRPPDTVAAIVADEPGAWPPDQQPNSEQQLLWQALRVTLLYHIWHARCSSDVQQQTSHAVVAATVSMLRDEIRLQYNGAYLREQYLHAVPTRVVRQQQRSAPADRLGPWLHPLIASLAAPPAGGAGSGAAAAPPSRLQPSQLLTIHLSLSHPVAAPAPPPAEA